MLADGRATKVLFAPVNCIPIGACISGVIRKHEQRVSGPS